MEPPYEAPHDLPRRADTQRQRLTTRLTPFRYWPVVLLAGWAIIAGSLWQWSAREAHPPRLLSDASGAPRLVVTAVNSARRAVLRNAPLVSALVNALPDDVRVLVLSNDPQAFEMRGRETGRMAIVTLPADVPITIWPQDPFLVLGSDERKPVLLASRRFARAGDAHVADAIAKHLGWTVKTSGLSFEGGNVVGGTRHVFIGADTVRLNAIELVLGDAEVVRRFEAELGRPVVVVGPVPQPVGHLDMVLTPVAEDRLVLADPGAGAAVARRALAQDAAAVARFERTVTARDLEGRTASAIRRSEAMAPLFDAVAEALEGQGYRVDRVPFLSNLGDLDPGAQPPARPYRDVLDYPVLTYNNVVLGNDGDGVTVYMPRFGFPAMDHAAESAWRELGFTVKGVDGFATSALYGGALRCTLKVLERR